VFTRDAKSQALLIPLDRLSFESSVTWLWTYSPSEQRLFKPENNGWVFFHLVSGRRHSVNQHYHWGGAVSTIPSDVSPAMVVTVQGLSIHLIARDSLPASPRQLLSCIFPKHWMRCRHHLPGQSKSMRYLPI
jgi:hypothetical protein